MITGRKIADGSNGKGEAPVRKTPLMAAVQATAAQSVKGTVIASQVVRRWPRSEVGAFKAEPQAERDESMDRQPNGQGRKAALRKHWQRVDQPRPQYRNWDGPKQAAPSGTRRDDGSGNGIGGHR